MLLDVGDYIFSSIASFRSAKEGRYETREINILVSPLLCGLQNVKSEDLQVQFLPVSQKYIFTNTIEESIVPLESES